MGSITSGCHAAGRSVIFNICSAPLAELEKHCPCGSGTKVLDRRDLRPKKLLSTLLGIRKHKADKLYLYCLDSEHQYNLFILKLMAVLMGTRDIFIVDAAGTSRRLTKAEFLMRDVPLLMATLIYLIGPFVAFSFLLGSLVVLFHRPRIRKIEARMTMSFCYLKTDFWFGLKAGGSVTHTREFIRASKQSGYVVTVIAPDSLESYRLPVAVRVIRPSRRLFDFPRLASQIEYNLRFSLGALGVIRQEKPQFLYQRSSQNNFSGVLLARLTGVPLVLEYNSSARWARLSGKRSSWSFVENLCDRINLNGADVIAVVSEELKARLARAGISPVRIVVNPNGVNPEAFSDTVDASFVKALLPPDRIFVGFIGIFGQWHGVLTLAESVKYVLEQEPRAHFLIIGDGVLKEEMVAILRRDSAIAAVTFTGVVAHEDAPRYLNACDILVSPHEDMADGSPFFGSPTKIFEYMAMGKGIIASRVGQLGQILEDERNALLVEQRNPRDLARAIVELIRSSDKRMELGREARRIVIEMYTWQHNFQRIVNHLQHIGY